MQRSHHREERGATLLWVILMMMILLGITALAVDFGLAYAVKRQLSSTADAAALAGAQEAGLRFKSTNGCPGGVPDPALVQAINSAVADTHTQNDPWGATGVPVPTITCDPTQVTVSVQEASSLNTIFARVLGINTLDPAEAATANVFGSTFGGGLRPFTVCVGDAREGKLDTTRVRQSYYTLHNNDTISGEVLQEGGDSTWTASNDEISDGSFSDVSVGDYVRLDVKSGATGASDGYYWVVWRSNNKKEIRVSTTFGGSAVNITADGVVDVYKQPPPIGNADAAWSAGSPGVLTTSSAHALIAGDAVWIAVKTGGGGASSGTYYVVSTPTNTTFTVATTPTGPPVDITSAGTVYVYKKQSLASVQECNPTGAPGNWGYASFGLGGSQPVLKCLITYGYGGDAGCLGDAIGTNLGDDNDSTPEVTAPGNSGNSIQSNPDFRARLTALLDETILLPVAGTWDQQGSNATYTAKGGAAVKVCGFAFPTSNTNPTPNPLLAGSCWDNNLYNAAAAVGNLDDVSLVLQWKYVDEYTGVYRGQSTAPSDFCELGNATCIPTVRLIG